MAPGLRASGGPAGAAAEQALRLVRHPRVRRGPRPFLFALLLVAVVMTLSMPRPTAACSCMVPVDPMRETAAAPDVAVFTGVIQRAEPMAVPVLVTRWFKGPSPARVVGLDPQGFEDPMGGSCGTHQPPLGTEWIFVTGRSERGFFSVHMCTTHADLGTEHGAELLAAANQVFGPPQAPPEPEATAEAAQDGIFVSILGAVAPLGVALAFGFGLLAGLVLILRRRGSGSGD
jgi:hypothetical protein